MVYWQTNQAHNEELDENFILPYMPICAIYMYIGIYIYMCRTFITRERTKKKIDLKMEIVVLENKPWKSLD